MKNTLNRITSGFIFAVFTVTICAPAATAAPVSEATVPGSSFISQNAVDQTANFESLTSKTLTDLSVKNFSAKVVLNESSGAQIIDAADSKQSLAALLESHGFDASDFRSSGNTAIDENYQLKNSENLSLFRSEASGSSSVVTLPAPEEKRDSPELYKGEEKVEKEGKDGQALRTVITTKILAADSKVNSSAKKANAEDSSEEKLTVLTAPEAKVILVGTKERTAAPVVATPPSAAVSQADGISQSASRGASTANDTPAPSPSVSPGKPANSSSNSPLVNLVMAQIGKPYVWGATGPDAFDCSGLVQWIFAKNFGYNIPRTAYAQGLSGTPVRPADMQPGDIVYTSYHIGIYVGNGKMVHAATPANGVVMEDVQLYLAQGYKISRL